jgi:hypothetical protein
MTQVVDLGKLRFYWADTWNSATEYELNDVVKYGGNAYVYTNALATTGNLPTNTAYWKVMVEGINFLGAYSNATAYKPGDAVTHGGNAYVCEAASTGNTPPNATYWSKLASGIQYEGAYNSATNYQKDDIVTSGGSVYIALQDHSNQAVSNATYWAKFVDGTYPDQAGNNNYILKTDGTSASWTDSISIADASLAGSLTAGDVSYIGPGAATFAGATDADLTNPALVVRFDNGQTEDSFAQIAFQNDDPTSSTDIIAYMDNGTDSEGWVGIGIAGSSFNDQTYGITAPGDGYIFHNTKAGNGRNGNLVLATGDAGDQNKIVIAAGGFASGNTQMVITPASTGVSANVHIETPTASTSPTTGALTVVGGVGISGSLNILGNTNITGNLTFGGGSTTTENLAVTNPLVFVGDGNNADASDLGLVGEYVTGGVTKYAGIVRDASDGVAKFFKDATTAPVSTVNFGEAGLGYLSIKTGAIDAAAITGSGDLTIATDKLVVNSTTGAITAAGTFTPSGLVTANGGITTSGTLTVTGGAAFSGTTDMQELRESVVDVTLASNVGTLNWSSGNIFYIATAPTGAMTFNVTNVPTDNSKIMTINVMVTQGSTGYIPTVFQIGGASQTIRWAGGSAPTPTSSANKVDIFSFTMFRTSTGSWIVYGASSLNF